jgi:hypothetical protein
VGLLSGFIPRIYTVRSHFQGRANYSFYHDNTRPHTTLAVERFWQKEIILELNYAPYFSISHKIKSTLEGKRYDDKEDIKINATFRHHIKV